MATPVDPAVTRARWAAFVDRALRTARDNGLSDREIHRRSGVSTSTFHRWRSSDSAGLPKLPQVRAFCAAVGASLEEAMRVLDMTDSGPAPTPEPPLPRDVRLILRRLADPNTPEVEKNFIRMSLQMLASRAGGEPRTDAQEAG